MPSLPYDAVLFDCDGVLADSERIVNAVLRECLIELGWDIGVEECFKLFVGRAVKDETAVITARTGFVVTDEWLERFRARRSARLAVEVQPIPGAVAAVTELDAAYEGRVACASGADRKKIEMQLRLIGLDTVLAGRVFSGMELPRTKPAPDVYLAAAAALGVDPTRAAVVEDAGPGVRAGVAAGATVYGYCPPGSPSHQSPETLLAAGATHIFTDMAELPDLLTTA